MLFTGTNPDVNSAAISFDGLHVIYDHSLGEGGMKIKYDTISHADITADTLNVITKHGLWVWMHYTELKDYISPEEVEYSELGHSKCESRIPNL